MKSNQEWKEWGKVDPLFAVSSWEGRQKDGANPWTDETFYALGASDWADFQGLWESYGYDRCHCLEIGCGAGRLTRQIATVFENVTAVDVSAEQLDYARSRIPSQNIRWAQTDGVHLPEGMPLATAVFSAHVFQHFDTLGDARRVLSEVQKGLAPGGSLMIHMRIYQLPSIPLTPLLRAAIRGCKMVETARANWKRFRGKLVMRGLSYERCWLVNTLEELGFCDIEFRAVCVRSNRDWHDFVLARKR